MKVDKKMIVNLRNKEGLTFEDIGRKYGVSRQYINKIYHKMGLTKQAEIMNGETDEDDDFERFYSEVLSTDKKGLWSVIKGKLGFWD